MAIASAKGISSRALLATLAWGVLASAALAADRAEYALRWDPVDGGPRTIEEVAAVLGLPAGKRKDFEVRYFTVAQPADLPPGASVIVRERGAGGSMESMYKLRSGAPLADKGMSEALRCAFPSASERKNEVDVGWTAAGTPKKSYSYSCTADGLVGTVLPPGLETRPTGCSSKVLRQQSKGVKIERWSLPGGDVALEVSWNGKDARRDLDQFMHQIVRPLLARGVKPLQESKTELGSRC